jgi:hypothetical protein
MAMVLPTNGWIQMNCNRLSLRNKEKPTQIQIPHHRIKVTMDNSMYLKVYWDRIILIRGLNLKIFLNIWKTSNAEKLFWILCWFLNCFFIMQPIFNKIAALIRGLSSIAQRLDQKKVLIYLNISHTSACHALDSQMKSWLFNAERVNRQKIRFLKEMKFLNLKTKMNPAVIYFHVILLFVLIAHYVILNM